MAGERQGRALGEGGIAARVGQRHQDQGRRVVGSDHGAARPLGRVDEALVGAEAGAELGGVGERLGQVGEIGLGERARRRPRAVVAGGVVHPGLGRGQLGQQRIGLRGRAEPVRVLEPALIARQVRGAVAQRGERAVEHHETVHQAGEAQRQVLDHRGAEVTAGRDDPVQPELIAHQRRQVEAVGHHVVQSVGAAVGIAEPAQVRRDHLEAPPGELGDVAGPDAARHGPAVHQQQRHPAAPVAVFRRQAPERQAGAPHRRVPRRAGERAHRARSRTSTPTSAGIPVSGSRLASVAVRWPILGSA